MISFEDFCLLTLPNLTASRVYSPGQDLDGDMLLVLSAEHG